MKTRICQLLALSALLAAFSCQKEPLGAPELEGGGLQLTLVFKGQDNKATKTGED